MPWWIWTFGAVLPPNAVSTAIVTDVSVIERLIGEAVERVLSDCLPSIVREATVKPFLSQSEVRDLTGWSNRKLSYVRETKQVEFTPLGRSYLYKTQSLLSFLESKRVKAKGSVPSLLH